MQDCIFCKIVNKELPCHKIYENRNVLVFLDIQQATKGHTLIIPKKHYQTFLETPKELSNEIFELAKKLGKIYMKVLKAKGINVVTNAYEAAGQTVPHFHVHVIPRYDETDKIQFTNGVNKFSDTVLNNLIQKISKELK